jgi:hypothetical protein
MTARVIPPAHKTVSGSKLIEALAASLTVIKADDDLTDAELGKFMHKGVDAGKAYRTGYAEMPVTAFFRGAERWNGRFANDALAMIGMKLVPVRMEGMSGQGLQTRLSRLLMELSIALEDGKVDEVEIARMKRTLVEAGEAIDAFRAAAA